METQEIERAIRQLRQLYDDCLQRRSRFAHYGYLAEVYRLYDRLRRNRATNTGVRRQLTGYQASCGHKRNHPIRTILDATSSVDNKTKSRWTRALRFAWHERKRWTKFETLLIQYGGIAGCADQYAALHPKYGKDSITYRDPVGRVYLVVSKSLARSGNISIP
jgi:hypothetical protein